MAVLGSRTACAICGAPHVRKVDSGRWGSLPDGYVHVPFSLHAQLSIPRQRDASPVARPGSAATRAARPWLLRAEFSVKPPGVSSGLHRIPTLAPRTSPASTIQRGTRGSSAAVSAPRPLPVPRALRTSHRRPCGPVSYGRRMCSESHMRCRYPTGETYHRICHRDTKPLVTFRKGNNSYFARS